MTVQQGTENIEGYSVLIISDLLGAADIVALEKVRRAMTPSLRQNQP